MIQIRNKLHFRFILTVILLVFIISCFAKYEGIWIDSLKCGFKVESTGVDNNPGFSWILKSSERNQKQTAYQLIISENENLTTDDQNTWNSGKINSEQSVGVMAKNLKLKPGTKYYWKVRVWDKNQIGSSWSQTTYFVTALFDKTDWKGAKWISLERMDDSLILVPGIPTWGRNTRGIATRRPVVPLFRKEFDTDKNIESAFLFIGGLGQYKAYINGAKISDDFLSPGWTHYQKTCLYNTYDITDKLIRGANAIGIIAGNGFYNINNERYRKLLITYGMPKVIARIKINYTDGSSESIVTDSEWKTTPSPITYSSIYGGENYDASIEIPDWSKPGLDDSDWQDVLLADHPGGELIPEITYPVKVMKTFYPKEIMQVDAASYTVDFGQNASGIIQIKVKGNKGDTIKIIPAELLNEDRSVNQKWTGSSYYYQYILKGEGIESWQPMFTYYGMRYAQVFGAKPSVFMTESDFGQAELLDISLLHTFNSTPQTGSFWCSNPLFNQIDTLIRYGIQSNMQSILTDCPHREKLGWLEQTYLMGNSIQHNYEVYHLYKKLVRDMMDSQRENGLIGSMAPEFIVFGDEFTDSPEWGSAIVMLPWLVYKWYGDLTLIKEAWPGMIRYMEYLDSKAEDHILSYGLGDWYDLGPNPPGVSQLSPIAATATSIYYLDYKVLSKMAMELHKIDEAKVFSEKAGQIKDAYNKLLFNEETGTYSNGSQTSMAIPLSMNMVEDQYRDTVLQNLIDSIIANKKSLTAGDIGFHYLIDALTENGRSQLIYEMNNRDDVPGYGYQIKKGATALTESWDALPYKSNNHLMLGHLEEWLYTGLGGIRQEENSVAYKSIIIQPKLIDGLEQVETSYLSPYGEIKSEWENRKDKVIIRVSIPVNTKARIYLPAESMEDVSEKGLLLQNMDEIKILGFVKDELVIETGSGDYNFLLKK